MTPRHPLHHFLGLVREHLAGHAQVLLVFVGEVHGFLQKL